MSSRAMLVTLLLLASCGRTRTLHGQVVDIWGAPIDAATIVIDGKSGIPASDAYGNFTVPAEPGTWKIKVGKEGYIQDQVDWTVTEGVDPVPPVIHLYPKPAETGFWLVGPGAYVRVVPERVYLVGNELQRITGLKTIETRVENGDFEVVFMTDLRMDEIMRLGLELTALEYKRTVELPGSLGPTEVRVNLYMGTEAIPLDITPMRSKNAYRITTSATLEPGWYAFHSQDLLDAAEPTDVEGIPEDLRVAFPFELR